MRNKTDKTRVIFATYFFVILSTLEALQASELAKTAQSPSAQEQKVIQKQTCPTIIEKLSKEDAEDGFMGLLENQKASCKSRVSRPKDFDTAYDFHLALKNYYPDYIGSTHQKVMGCIKGDDEEARYKVAKYYYEIDRLQAGTSDVLHQIAAIDSLLLNAESLDNQLRPTAYLTKASKDFAYLKTKCSQSSMSKLSAIREQVEKSMEADEIVHQYEKIKSAIKNYSFVSSRDLSAREMQRKVKLQEDLTKLEPLYQMAVANAPWVLGKDFQKHIQKQRKEEKTYPSYMNEKERRAKRAEAIQRAMNAQLTTNRKLLVEQLKDYNQTSACIFGAEDPESNSCDMDFINETLSKTPDVNTPYKGQKLNTVAQYLEVQECIHSGKIDLRLTEDILQDASINAVLTAASAGGAAALSVGSLRAVQALRSGQGVVNAYKARTLGNLSTLTADAAWVGIGTKDAIKTCSDEQEIALRSVATAEKQCPRFDNEVSSAYQNYNSCVGAIAMASVDFIPFAGFAAGPIARAYKATKSSAIKPGAVKPMSKSPAADGNVNDFVNTNPTVTNAPPKDASPFTTKPAIEDLRAGQDVAVRDGEGFVNAKVITNDKKKLRLAVEQADGSIKIKQVDADDVHYPFQVGNDVNFIDKDGKLRTGKITLADNNKMRVTYQDSGVFKLKYEDVDANNLMKPLESGDVIHLTKDGVVTEGRFIAESADTIRVNINGKVEDLPRSAYYQLPKKGDVIEYRGANGELDTALARDVDANGVKVLLYRDDGRAFIQRLPFSLVSRKKIDAESALRQSVSKQFNDSRLKKSYESGSFTDDSQFVIVELDATRKPAKILGVRSDGSLDVTFDNRKLENIDPSNFSKLKTSEIAKRNFQALGQDARVDESLRYFSQQENRFIHGKVVDVKKANKSPDRILVEYVDSEGRFHRRYLRNTEVASATYLDDYNAFTWVQRQSEIEKIRTLEDRFTRSRRNLENVIAVKTPKPELIRQSLEENNQIMTDLAKSMNRRGYQTELRNGSINVDGQTYRYKSLKLIGGPQESLAAKVLDKITARFLKPPDGSYIPGSIAAYDMPTEIYIDPIKNTEQGSGGLFNPNSNHIYLNPSAVLNENPNYVDSILFHELIHAQTSSLKRRKVNRPYYVTFKANEGYNLISRGGKTDLYDQNYSLDEVRAHWGQYKTELNSRARAARGSKVYPGRQAGDGLEEQMLQVGRFIERSRDYIETALKDAQRTAADRIKYVVRDDTVTAQLPLTNDGKKLGSLEVALIKAKDIQASEQNKTELIKYLNQVLEQLKIDERRLINDWKKQGFDK